MINFLENGLEYAEEEKHVFGIITGFFRTKVLSIALQLDLFTFLAECPKQLKGIQNLTTFPPRPMRIFLEALITRSIRSPYMNDGVSFSTKNFRRVVPVEKLPNPTIDEDFLREINRAFFERLESVLRKGK